MRVFFSAFLIFCFQFSFGQKLNIGSLEKILDAPFNSADTMLKNSKFRLSDKDAGKGYKNYYYTAYENPNTPKQVLRSLSIMDIYSDGDTSRLILYRTYNKTDQEEMIKQLLATGYEISKRSGNDFIYKKGIYTVTNKISNKNVPGSKPVTAYEFELGR